ncbi:hypothetical protein K1719_016762 [Acacia pycnantha]|nr:hypothetical protein K1719_016762 [Acacia pycnantha]
MKIQLAEDMKEDIVSETAMGVKKLILMALVLLLLTTMVQVSAADSSFILNNGFQSIIMDGGCSITSNGLLQLTDETRRLTCHAFYPESVDFSDNDSFSTTFVFAIRSQYSSLSGHGMAFVISPTKGFPGALPGPHLGLFNDTNNGVATNHVFAVELDTFQDMEFNDIDDNHVGIDINGLRSSTSAPAGYYVDGFQFHNLSLNSGLPMQVWVDYDGGKKQVEVTLAPININKPETPLLRLSQDLSHIINNRSYVGFSASNGFVARASHNVLGWSFKLNGEAQNLEFSKLPKLRGLVGKQSVNLSIMLPLLSLCLIVFVSLFVVCYIKKKRNFSETVEEWEQNYGPHRFKYRDLYFATKGFKEKEVLGFGGFGKVYKGTIPGSKIEVAVKKVSHNSQQGMREFIAEVVSIGRLRHRNLVSLLGYWRRKGELLLVYEFMPYGSLDKYLYKKPGVTLNWMKRFKIIKSVVLGLCFLHEEWEQVVVHRDVKASNVMLDSEWNGRLGDFGLARLYDHGAEPRTTHVAGTLGYLAPENIRTGRATKKSDVFAFGVFMLEVVCGRRPRDLLPQQVQGCSSEAVGAVFEGFCFGEVDALGFDIEMPHSHLFNLCNRCSISLLAFLNLEYWIAEDMKEDIDSKTAMGVKKLILMALVLLLVTPMVQVSGAESSFIFNNGFQSIIMDGSYSVTSNGLLQLTDETKLLTGHAFYPESVGFSNSDSFSTTFVFAIRSQYRTLGAHGMAFVISPTKGLPGALPGPYLGLFNGTNNGVATNHVFAVELDTFRNMEFDDINHNHVGIDINGLNSSTSAPAGYYVDGFQFHNLSLNSGLPMQVWVDYDGGKKQVEVTLAPININKPETPLLRLSQDLSHIINNLSYVGFSASTGFVAWTSHNVLGWSFKLNGEAQNLQFSKLPKLPGLGGKQSVNLSIMLPLLSLCLIVFVSLFVVCYIKKKRNFSEIVEEWEQNYGTHRFKYRDLYFATKGFKEKEVLGFGGFGKVYKGTLPGSKIEVAVKKVSHNSQQGIREFIAEVVSIGRLRHRNLVSLLGYCRRKGELLLVSELMPNGSLDKYIYKEPGVRLNWMQRFKIIKGVALGLSYLHEEWEQVVVHRDVKASNVMLDSEFNGRLGDFGLARLYDHGAEPITTHVAGTLGYLAPENMRTGRATKKSDVFAFGVFMLEVVCGRRPRDLNRPSMPQVVQYLNRDVPLPDCSSLISPPSFSGFVFGTDKQFDAYSSRHTTIPESILSGPR